MICHGENFLSTQPATVGTWNLRLDRMMGKNLFDKPAASYAEGLLTYRASALRFSREDREIAGAVSRQELRTGGAAARGPRRQGAPARRGEARKAHVRRVLPDARCARAGHQRTRVQQAWTGAFAGRRASARTCASIADGNVWLTDRGYPNRFVKLDPRTGEQKAYVLPESRSAATTTSTSIAPGSIWLAEAEGQKPSAEKHLLGFNPKTEKFESSIPMDPDNVVRNDEEVAAVDGVRLAEQRLRRLHHGRRDQRSSTARPGR